MEHNAFHHDQNDAYINPSGHGAAMDGGCTQEEFEPTADSLTETAYYMYLDHGSIPGHDMKNWLESEALVLKERSLDRRALSQDR